MRNMMKKAAQNVKAVAVRAGMLMKDTKGENYVDTAVKILIAVVLGALLAAARDQDTLVAPNEHVDRHRRGRPAGGQPVRLGG